MNYKPNHNSKLFKSQQTYKIGYCSAHQSKRYFKIRDLMKYNNSIRTIATITPDISPNKFKINQSKIELNKKLISNYKSEQKYINKKEHQRNWTHNISISNYQLIKDNINLKNWRQKTKNILNKVSSRKKTKQIQASSFYQEFKQNINTIQEYKYSRFEIHELKSFYLSLLSYSKGNIHKFKKGFEVMLSFQNITIREEIIQECFKNNFKKFAFLDFIKMYSCIDRETFKQTVIDYMNIIFQNYSKYLLAFNDIHDAFLRRCDKRQAYQRASLIYEKIGVQKIETIKIQDIYNICHKDQAFCHYMHNLYLKEIGN